VRAFSGADEIITHLADRQHGVVTRRQLLQLGLGGDVIDHRIRSRVLRPLHRGVFAVGHTALRPEGIWLAAVLACGPRAVLSHASALAAWELRESISAVVDVTVPGTSGRRSRRGVRLFRHVDLRDHEVTRLRGIPITTVPRTLLDAATILERHALRRAVEAAFRRHRLTVAGMRRVLGEHPGRPGVWALRSIVDDFDAYGVTFTRSELEARMLQLCLDHGLPRPLVNRRSGGREVDFRWPEQRPVVKTDGWATHSGRRQCVADHARDRAAVLRGETVLRYTHHDISARPAAVAAEIRHVLGRR